jgi:hypothetical protein
VEPAAKLRGLLRGAPWGEWLKPRWNWLAIASVVMALVVFTVHAERSYPLAEWSTFFWARAWLAMLAFGVASLATGLKELELLKVRAWSLAERSAVAMALGVLTFALGIYVVGLLGGLGLAFFLSFPALMLLFGGRALARHARQMARLRARFGPGFTFPQSLPQALAALLIAASAFGLYLQIITPGNISFDARLYHLVMAEGYAVTGQIRPYPEGWYFGAYPQLSSWIYAWGFLAPGEFRDHANLAAHLEFLLLLATVGGTSALASRLISGARLRHGGAAIFLFPGIFAAGTNLNCGADHVLAFWAAPIGLVLLRYVKRGDTRHAALLGALIGAAALTRYQVVYFAAPAGLVVAWVLLRRRKLGPALMVAGAALVVSSPHWLKNWIAYSDPMYPALHKWFPSQPLFKGAPDLFARGLFNSSAPPPKPMAETLLAAGRDLFEWSFSPRGWGRYPNESAVFGSLFTLLLPLYVWVRPRWRTLLIVGGAHVGIFVWILTYPFDRYLHALVPWMAACVAVALAAAWRMGPVLLRFGVVLLVGFQLAWGGDVYLLLTHWRMGELPLHPMDAANRARHFVRNAYPGEELTAIGKKLPKGSKPIAHDFYQSLGVGVQTISDNADWQGAINYLQIEPPQKVLATWRRLGATHLIWPFQKEARIPEWMAHDAVFARASVAFTDSSFTVARHERPHPHWMACLWWSHARRLHSRWLGEGHGRRTHGSRRARSRPGIDAGGHQRHLASCIV